MLPRLPHTNCPIDCRCCVGQEAADALEADTASGTESGRRRGGLGRRAMVRLPGNLGRGTVAERNRLLEQRQRACDMADQEALEARKREAEAKARKSAAEAKVEAARKVVEAGLEAERLAIECASDMKSGPSSISSLIASNVNLNESYVCLGCMPSVEREQEAAVAEQEAALAEQEAVVAEQQALRAARCRAASGSCRAASGSCRAASGT